MRQFMHMPPWNVLLRNTDLWFWKLELATVGGTIGHVTSTLLVTRRTNNRPSVVTYNVRRMKIVARRCQP
jgi:hypothetical protein